MGWGWDLNPDPLTSRFAFIFHFGVGGKGLALPAAALALTCPLPSQPHIWRSSVGGRRGRQVGERAKRQAEAFACVHTHTRLAFLGEVGKIKDNPPTPPWVELGGCLQVSYTNPCLLFGTLIIFTSFFFLSFSLPLSGSSCLLDSVRQGSSCRNNPARLA